MNNVVMDATLLSSLMSCARLTDLRFHKNLKSPGGKSNALETGSLAHTILEHFYKAVINGKSRADAIAIGYEAGKEYVKPYSPSNIYVKEEDHEGLQNTPPDSDKYKTGSNYVFETLAQYFEHWKNYDTFTPIAVEEVRQKVIYEDDDLRVLWRAKYDLISDTPNGILSTDHKTMKQRRDTLSLNNQFMGQCVLLNTRNVLINKIGFQTSLKPEEKFTRVLVNYSSDRLAEWANEIVPYYASLYAGFKEADYYPPNFTHCENKYGFCNFKDYCEHDRSMRPEVEKVEFIVGKPWDPVSD